MNASLVMVRDDGRQQEIALKRQAIIGRQTDCNIRIPDNGISRHHCEVSVGEGSVTLRDLGSSNGTFVNRVKVTQAELGAGDLVAIGNLVFVVKIDGSPAVVDAEEAWDEGAVPPGVGGGHASAKAPTAVAKNAAPAPAAKPAAAKPAPAKPPAGQSSAPAAKRPSVLDENEGSSVDFDFLDEDDDIKKQPKL